MAADDVAPTDMSLFGSRHDPVDAALLGGSDDPAVDALVRDLRAAYLPDEPVARSAALLAFTGEPAVAPAPARIPVAALTPAAPAGRARVAAAVAALVASLGGKIVLGGAVAAAAIGGLHATEVVDVPLLPDVDRPGLSEDAPDVPASLDLPPVTDDVQSTPRSGPDRTADGPSGRQDPGAATDVPEPLAPPTGTSAGPDVADDQQRPAPDPTTPAPDAAPGTEAPTTPAPPTSPPPPADQTRPGQTESGQPGPAGPDGAQASGAALPSDPDDQPAGDGDEASSSTGSDEGTRTSP